VEGPAGHSNDGTTLELRLSQTPVRPALATLSHVVDLVSLLGTTQAYVGFTSGTGAAFANHDILTWRFDNAFAPIGGGIGAGTTEPVPTLSGWALAALVVLAAAAGWHAMRRRA
jgi:IPTL-CTERM motif/Legume lectin domain